MEALGICLFRLSAACGPLGDDPQRAAEPLHLEVPPQLCAVTMAGGPLSVEPLKMGFERTLAGAEDVRAPTAQHVTNKAAAMSGAAHDLLDRGPVLGQSENGGVGLFSTEVTFILDTLGSGEQAGIDRCGADRGTDLPHGLANGIEKGATGVLHEMPAVSDLSGIRQRPGRGQRIAAATIARDNGDLWLTGEPLAP